MPDNLSPSNPLPPVNDRRTNPPGILPRNSQTLVLAGVAALMVAVIGLSGRKPAKEKVPPSAETAAIDPNAARIQEYEKRIEEQTRKVQSEQAQLLRSQQALGGLAPDAVGANAAAPYPANASRLTVPRYTVAQNPEDSGLDLDQKRREYQSLFASNVALSLRKESMPQDAGPNTSSARLMATPVAAAVQPQDTSDPIHVSLATPSVSPTQSTRAPASENSKPQSADSRDGARAPGARSRERDSALANAPGKTYRLFEGTVIETVLTNRLDGSFSGPVNCMVTTNVYSHNGQHVLIPQGSRVLGEVRRVDTLGQQRLAVVFHRLIMPDGYSVSLDQFHGLNQIGETGLVDQVNRHYVQLFGVSLAIGAVSGLSAANTTYGADESALDAYRQGVASSLSQSSMRILDRYLNVLPTITIREGHRVKIYLSDDMLLPAYEQHQMPEEL